ncbi:MAG: flagellar export chaperone FliS [Planctomycetaceae bacterium]|nr:flagellar export chaperone FliS [Planctomycetaceae bacterium]
MPSQQTAQQTYIVREALTATPQKLQLMLIEAAIKNIHRTKMHWENNAAEEAFTALTRVQDIITEILCSLDMEGSPDIAKSIASIYVFIFRKIAMAKGPNDIALLDDALKVLMAERESWREICEKFGSTTDGKRKSATFESKTQKPAASGSSALPATREIRPTAPHLVSGKQKTQETTVSKGFSRDA